ncbi:MAG: N-6 DNA methylase [Ilumatobacteraceae bacterium]
MTRDSGRKQRGAWYTPSHLVEIVSDGVLREFEHTGDGPVRVLDPACGDGRMLAAVGDRLVEAGWPVALTGCDIDVTALDSVVDRSIRLIHADALSHDWGAETFDLVIGNPPFLSQMAVATTRGGSSRHGGGPYADAAVEFLSLAVALAAPDGGRIGLVLPQSLLGARDAAPVRASVAEQADLTWSWWEPDQRHFDAAVNVCLLGLQRPSTGATTKSTWTRVVTDRLGVPTVDVGLLATDGVIADRADLNVNFRDEYYALVPAVSDDADGPPLITSGLIDAGRCHWGARPVRFAKRDFEHPRVDLSKLDGRFPAWAARKLVPKVLIANQTRIIEAVADPDGSWLPGVPVTTATPIDDASTGQPDNLRTVWEIAAVLTSPIASIAAWRHSAGTGLSTTSVRIGPGVIGAVPWPAGDLGDAVDRLQAGDVRSCGLAVCGVFGLSNEQSAPAMAWWNDRLPLDQ